MTQNFTTIETMRPLRRGTKGMGTLSEDSAYIANGHYPLVDVVPEYDSSTQSIISELVVDEATKTVVKTYTVIDIPLEELIAKKIVEGEAYLKSTVNTELQKFNTKYGTIFEKVNDMSIYIMDTTYYLRTECDTLVKWNNLFYATARAKQGKYTQSICDDVLEEAMQSLGVGYWTRKSVRMGLRIGGSKAYQEHRSKDVK
jgi:hypothetical protein